jgi:hypothetical protein
MDPELSITNADTISVPAYKRIRWRLWLFIASPFLLMGGCSLFFFHARSTYLPAAVEASSQLHEELARGEEAQIYENADLSFQNALPAPTALKFFARIRRKLGVCQYSGPTGWNANADSSGTFVTMTYHEQCSNGSGDETLRWKLDNGSARLVYFNVNSPEMLTD